MALEGNLNSYGGTSGQLVGVTLLSSVDVSLLSGSNFRFSVGSGTVEDMTVSVSGNSLLTVSGLLTTIVNLLGAGNTLNADLSVVNTATGEVVAIAANSVSISASLIGGLTYSGTASFANLPAGDYTMVISSPNSTGTLVSLINALAAAQVATFVNVDVTDSVGYSVGAIEGNVLDTTSSGDMADSGSGITVTSAVSDSVQGSTAVTVTSGGVNVAGAYGVLTIHSDGSYSYQLTKGGAAIGKSDVFSYTITDAGGHTSTTSLTINIGGNIEPAQANPDTQDTDLTATFDTLNGESGTIGQLVGVSLLGSVSVSALNGNSFDFDVAAGSNEKVQLAVSGSAGLSVAAILSLLGGASSFTADLSIVDKTTGLVVEVLSNAVSINASGINLVYSGGGWTSMLPTGSYTAIVSSPSTTGILKSLLDLNLGTYVNVSVADSQGYHTDSLAGNVLQSDVGGDVADTGVNIKVASVTATSVNGSEPVSVSSSGTTIAGAWGSLTIHSDGSYTYQPYGGVNSVGKSEVFTYTITDSLGHTASTTLTIDIDSPASLAVNDVVALNVATALATSVPASINAANLASSGASGTGSTKTINFSVAAGHEQDNTSLALSLSGKTNSGLASGTITFAGTVILYHLVDNGSGGTTSVEVWRDTYSKGVFSLLGATSSDSVTLSVGSLAEGNYTLSLQNNVTAGTASTYTLGGAVTGVVIDTVTHYTVAGTNVSGNIQNGNNSGGTEDFHGVLYASYTVAGHTSTGSAESWTFNSNGSITTSNGSAVSGTSVTIFGDYGNLTMANNGSYTYSLKAGMDVSTITHKEVFAYTVNDSNGVSSGATLTIDLHPQITGSINGDDIHSTAYNDTFTMGVGADTVVYNLLADDNTGGNGSDTWKDFSVAQGDHIDVSALLVGWDGNSSSLGNYVTLSYVGSNTVVSIDRDGGAGNHQSTTLITLEGVHINTLNELLDTNNSN
ncbi:type I secretion C-terminal target domain-containing protein [Klebsiella sp. RHBSTW-00215]|uniref:type I secretion C-terminal target domain-containing protein n=1 Tax=Klebsiella sp. RHBSTW-00215 TaxID=2742640 RepID=UPI001E51D761|nr:type I secretion C-terminal target domain-containing protein [Klebsiella sp. RHBSTW-00215]